MEAALRAIANPKRRTMLRLLRDGERSASELAEGAGLTRPATSQHLRVLKDADLVAVRADGNHRYYRARPDRIEALKAFLDDFWSDRLDTLRQAVADR